MPNLRLLPLHGRNLMPYLTALGALRLQVFREFPYLYEGTLEDEHHYLQTYVESPSSLVIDQAAELASALSSQLPGWKAQLWSDDDSARLAAMRNEQTMMQFVLSIIALVAAFSVMNTTITVTTQKRREIGVIAAIGGRHGQIVNVFLFQAVIVGVLGTTIGLVGSLLVLWLRNDVRELLTLLTGGQVHAVEGVFLSSIPAHLQPWDVALTCTTSILLCIVAGFLPAWFAARMDPAVALRD